MFRRCTSFLGFPVLILLSYSLVGQPSIFPSGVDLPVWQVTNFGDGGPVPLKFAADSVKVSICGQDYYPVYSDEFDFSIANLFGYYRSEGEKVFFRPKDADCELPEELLYDFGLEIGDSISLRIEDYVSKEEINLKFGVACRDTVLNGPFKNLRIKLQRLEIDPDSGDIRWYGINWIEGVGSNVHPFYLGLCFAVLNSCDVEHSLQCLRINSNVVYSRSNDVSCTYPVLYPNRYYVKSSIQAGIQADGRSWQTAFTDLQDALAVAVEGDSIWVAQGDYFPTDGIDRRSSFEIPSGVTVFGGFSGNECELSERNPLLFISRLNGDIGDVGMIADNVYHVVSMLGNNEETLIDGFTISNGYAKREGNGIYGSDEYGGGILVRPNADNSQPSRPWVRNCIFQDNYGKNGGAIAFYDSNQVRTTPKILDCQFINNHGLRRGGGVYKFGATIENDTAIFQNCQFIKNDAWRGGGAVELNTIEGVFKFTNVVFDQDSTFAESGGLNISFLKPNVSLLLEDCVFEKNLGNQGAGLSCIYNANEIQSTNPQITTTRTIFKENIARSNKGGAIAIYAESSPVDLILDQVRFENNTGFTGASAMYIVTDNTELAVNNIYLNRCEIIDNYTNTSGYTQSAAIVLEPFFAQSFCSFNLTIENSLFKNNRTALGLYVGFNGTFDVNINNCTFTEHNKYLIRRNWKSIFNDSTYYQKINISNSILWEENIDPNRLILNEPLSSNIFNVRDIQFDHVLFYEDLCQLNGGIEACGEGLLIGQSPRFVDVNQGNYQLSACSPAINAGANSFLSPNTGEFDLAGSSRVQEEIVDLGAYERTSSRLVIDTISTPKCVDSQDGFVQITANGDAPYFYSWEQADGSMGVGLDSLAGGDYQISVLDATGCLDTIQVNIPIPSPIEANYEISNATSAHPSSGSIQQLSIIGGTSPFTYLWDNGATQASLDSLEAGIYTLTITDSNGCIWENSYTVDIINNDSEPSIIPPVQLYPNPARNRVHLETTVFGSFLLFDLTGQLITQIPVNHSTQILEVAELARGRYFWQLIDSEGYIWHGKLILQ